MACLAGAGVMAAQTGPQEQTGPAPVVKAYRESPERWPQVGFEITVMDRDDEPVKGIAPEQLVILDNGRPVTGARLTAEENEPESVCLLVDTSGSTYRARAAIQKEVLELGRGLPAQDEVCAIAFSEKAYMDLKLSAERGALLQWAGNLRAFGGTALRDAVRGAAMELESNGRYRSRAIVLISDGGENASKTSEQELMAALHAPGAPVIYALVNEGLEAAGHADRNRLLEMTQETGGLEFPIKDDRDRDTAVERLMRAMAGRQRLVYKATEVGPHRLEVRLNAASRKQKMKVVAPHGYDGATQQ